MQFKNSKHLVTKHLETYEKMTRVEKKCVTTCFETKQNKTVWDFFAVTFDAVSTVRTCCGTHTKNDEKMASKSKQN